MDIIHTVVHETVVREEAALPDRELERAKKYVFLRNCLHLVLSRYLRQLTVPIRTLIYNRGISWMFGCTVFNTA
jgi:hypothetical protein